MYRTREQRKLENMPKPNNPLNKLILANQAESLASTRVGSWGGVGYGRLRVVNGSPLWGQYVRPDIWSTDICGKGSNEGRGNSVRSDDTAMLVVCKDGI